jgi:hypothetical protein
VTVVISSANVRLENAIAIREPLQPLDRIGFGMRRSHIIGFSPNAHWDDLVDQFSQIVHAEVLAHFRLSTGIHSDVSEDKLVIMKQFAKLGGFNGCHRFDWVLFCD